MRLKTLSLLLALSAALTTTAGWAQHQLNLQDAQIQTLIGTVAEITNKNFVIDPQVQGTVNVISNKDMNADEIYDLFLSILKVHGYAAVPSGDFIRIVPDAVARQDSIMTSGGRQRLGADDLVTEVIELKYVSAAEMFPLLRPLIPQNAQMVAHESSNSLVVSDRVGNIARLRDIVRRIDTANQDELELIPLQHASAAEVVRMLESLNGPQAAGAGPSKAKAVADERTNSVLISGDPSLRLRYRTLISHLDTPLESDESTQVISLKYASAEDLVPILESVARSADVDAGPAAAEGTTYIQAHPATNSLVVSASPAIYRTLQSVVRQLDIRRQQILVEAIIAEVSDDLTKELGVQWQSTSLDSLSDSGVVGGTSYPTNNGQGPGILGLGLGADGSGLGALGALGSGLTLGYLAGTITIGDMEIAQLGALVRALDANADTNVLSTPSIVTLDHQEALINVGQEVPFLTGQFTNTGANNSSVNPFQTIDRKDVGLKLKVVPHVNEGDTIILDINQEVSSLIGQSGAVDLITSKRELATTVMVPDGGMLVLGGLIDETINESINKVPALGDIPVVGNLFKYRSARKVKRNLMVFIRPRILQEGPEANAVTQGRYDYMRQVQQAERDKYEGLLKVEDLPLLPTASDLSADQPPQQ